MNVYKVWTEDWIWDEFDAVCVVAKDEERALEVAKEFFNEDQFESVTVTLIDVNEEQVVLSSYNAG